MANPYLASHVIDLDAEMAKIQFGESTASSGPTNLVPIAAPLVRIEHIHNVSVPRTDAGTRWDILISDGRITSVSPHDQVNTSGPHNGETPDGIQGHGALIAPSLCHPHIHLDKAFLLAHPKFAHLQIEEGTFAEAMDLTGQAKAHFEHDDLWERGMQVVNESVSAGVTHMRAFVEVDPIVGLKCLEAGRRIKQHNSDLGRCEVQICAFAQLPLFTGDDGGREIRHLMTESCQADYMADTIGSTPYVEDERSKMEANVEWLVDLALETNKHLDFHLDYNLDPDTEPLIWHVIETLKSKRWTTRTNKTIVLGHCTRLTLFKDADWKRLKDEIGDLPISFVGLPTSDLYMMKSAEGARGTLPVPMLIKPYGLNAAIGINNIGNAFTPQGSCDPLYVASLGVGVYQAGTKTDAEILYECVSTRARAAIGMDDNTLGGGADATSDGATTLQLQVGQLAHLLLFAEEETEWRTKHSVADAIYLYDGGRGRMVLLSGCQAR